MSESIKNMNPQEIKRVVNTIGLCLDEFEINELQNGNRISLENKSLSEIGLLFILAATISASKFRPIKKTITFQDLPNAVSNSVACSGIPVYSWSFNSDSNKRYLYLTMLNGKPALQTCWQEQK